jgi:hypothetical protein
MRIEVIQSDIYSLFASWPSTGCPTPSSPTYYAEQSKIFSSSASVLTQASSTGSINVTIRAIAVGPSDFCLYVTTPVADCASFSPIYAMSSQLLESDQVSIAKDTFARIFPNDFSGNTACYKSYMNATCRAAYPPCNPTTGAPIDRFPWCQELCASTLQQLCGVFNSTKAAAICSVLPSCQAMGSLDWVQPYVPAPLEPLPAPVAQAAPERTMNPPVTNVAAAAVASVVHILIALALIVAAL